MDPRARASRPPRSGLGGLAAVTACTLLAACTAYRLPPIPDAPASPPPTTLGTARIAPPPDTSKVWDAKVKEYLDRLQADLGATGLFTSVTQDQRATADVVVDPDYDNSPCFSQPIIMIVSLGLVPDPGCYRSGYHLTLRGPALPGGVISIDNRSAPSRLTGLLVGPLTLLPGWSSSRPHDDEIAALRAAILKALVEQRPQPATAR